MLTTIKRYIESIIKNEERDYTDNIDLQKLFDDLPDIINTFIDFTDEEKYRLMATDKNGNLAKIRLVDSNTGKNVYVPINQEGYKNIAFELLTYALILYCMYHRGVKYSINSDEIKIGEFEILDKQLPHLLGIEPHHMKRDGILEEVIPGYKQFSHEQVLSKILFIIQNSDKIIKYESQNGYDVFNYYKMMQKLKSFLLLGNVFHIADNVVHVYSTNKDNTQIVFEKRTNMNDIMQRSVVKVIARREKKAKRYYALSLQTAYNENEQNYKEYEMKATNRPSKVTFIPRTKLSADYAIICIEDLVQLLKDLDIECNPLLKNRTKK